MSVHVHLSDPPFSSVLLHVRVVITFCSVGGFYDYSNPRIYRYDYYGFYRLLQTLFFLNIKFHALKSSCVDNWVSLHHFLSNTARQAYPYVDENNKLPYFVQLYWAMSRRVLNTPYDTKVEEKFFQFIFCIFFYHKNGMIKIYRSGRRTYVSYIWMCCTCKMTETDRTDVFSRWIMSFVFAGKIWSCLTITTPATTAPAVTVPAPAVTVPAPVAVVTPVGRAPPHPTTQVRMIPDVFVVHSCLIWVTDIVANLIAGILPGAYAMSGSGVLPSAAQVIQSQPASISTGNIYKITARADALKDDAKKRWWKKRESMRCS